VFATTSTVNTTLTSLTGALNFVPTAVSPHVVYFLPTAACRDTTFDTINIVTPVPPVFVAPGNACLMEPFAIMSGTPAGGTFSTSNPSLIISNDTIWISSSLPGGPYPITYTVTDGFGCEASLTDNFSIINLDTPWVQYPRPGYCQNEGPQAPVFGPAQVSAGIFSANVLGGGPLAVGIDTDGTLHPDVIPPGTYEILFAYNNSACNAPMPVDTIIISTAPSAFFTVDSLACESNLFLDLDTTGGGNLGTLELFSGGQVVPSGSALFSTAPDRINFTIGGIQLDTNTTYFIQNIYTNALGCSDTVSASFLIQPDQNSNFAYLNQLYCANTSNPTPFIYGVGGGYYSCPLLDTTQLDSATGLLNLISAFTDPNNNQVDSFLIVYTSPGPCATSSSDLVLIREGFDSYFQFPVSITCSSRDTITPTDVATLNPAVSRFGQLLFHPNSPTLPIGPSVTFDQNTGVITGLANLNIPFGADTSLYFYHETGASGLCIERTVQRLQISRFDPNFNIDYSPDTVCGDHILQAALGGDVSEAYMNNPIGVTYASSGLGDIDARFSLPGSHIIVMSNRAICGERDSTNIFILGTPNASFEYNAPNICTGDSTFEPLPLATPNGVFTYDAIQSFDRLNLDSLTGIVTVAGSDPGNYWVYYEATSNDGCVAVDSQLIVISLSPQIDSLRANPGTSVCRNTPISFTCFSSGGTVSWFTDTLDLQRTGPIVNFDSLRHGQTVRAVLRSTAGCTDTASLQMEILAPPSITILDRPYVVVEADPFQIQLESNQDNTIVFWHAEAIGLEIDSTDGQKGVLNALERTALTNGIRLRSDYDPGEINYVFIPITNGCIGDSLFVQIEVNPNTLSVFIPEVITPGDGNGPNDFWEIRYDFKITASDYYIEVYNRAGGLVKTLADLNERWEGTSDSGQPLGDGVYWWLLKKRAGGIEQGGGLTIRRH
jgi:gliding motility-associated-like protein